MYYDELAIITRDHLQTHIGAYLETIETAYSDNIKLVIPKAIEVHNLVGGVYSVNVDQLPAYAIDVMRREFVSSADNDYLYQYIGHIGIIVKSGSEASANKTCKRHLKAVEKFVKEHQYLHETDVVTDECYIHEFGFAGSALSGAAKVDDEHNRESWVAGARVDVVWVTRETGWFQHG